MEELPAQLLPVLPHFKFLIFNITIPNLVMELLVLAVFFLAAWARLPKWIERGRDPKKGAKR
jgi:hypothetical protein